MNKPTIIVLRGPADSGKTTTIKEVNKKLIALGAEMIQPKYIEESGGDFAAKLRFRGKTIGIVSTGDLRKYQKDFFDSIGNDCDIYVCASRTKGETVKYIEERFPKSVRYIHGKHYYKKENPSERLPDAIYDRTNLAEAEIIIENILELI